MDLRGYRSLLMRAAKNRASARLSRGFEKILGRILF